MAEDGEPPVSSPRDDVQYPPWIWLTLAVVFVACLVFVSIRRAQTLELLARLREYSHTHLPFLSRSGGIRLSSSDIENNLPLDSDSDSDPEDMADELPSLVPPRPPTLTQRSAHGLHGLLATLGWTGNRLDPSSGADRGRDAWFQRVFGGRSTRSGASTGGAGRVRLAGPAADHTMRRQGFNGILDRVSDVVVPSYRSHIVAGVPPSPRASTSPTLFALGEEDENADAVELPDQFSLPARSVNTTDDQELETFRPPR